MKNSVNDDLESFFQDLQHGNEFEGNVCSYFLPKLTKEEMKLVEMRDPNYLKSFCTTFIGGSCDVDEAEMKMSESDSKFVDGFGWRETFTIENRSI